MDNTTVIPVPALKVTVYNGKYTVVQEPNGRVHALRYGEPWRDCVGDGLILALAQEIESLREQIKSTNNEPWHCGCAGKDGTTELEPAASHCSVCGVKFFQRCDSCAPEFGCWSNGACCKTPAKPFRQDIFDHFAQNHGLTLTESEMEDIAQVVSKDLCSRITNLTNENTAWRADSQQLERMVEVINEATPEFETAMGAPCDHAEVALKHLIDRLEKCEAALPVPDNQGIRLGKNAWLSWDKLVGWGGEDEQQRAEFYKSSIIAKAIMAWRDVLLAARSTTKEALK